VCKPVYMNLSAFNRDISRWKIIGLSPRTESRSVIWYN
jgi:hypothetical protein